MQIAVEHGEGEGATGNRSAAEHRCMVCGEAIVGRRGWAYYCSQRCKARAVRRRRRGVPLDAYPHGGGRGKVRLNELTHAERAAQVVLERPDYGR